MGDEPLPGPPSAPEAGDRERHGAMPAALLGVGVGAGVAVAAVAAAFTLIAVPLYVLGASGDGSGLDRDLVRRGLLGVAVPVGVVVGVVVGVLVAVWFARGGRLPEDRVPLAGPADPVDPPGRQPAPHR